jgi:SAM-dependent methyltransferase
MVQTSTQVGSSRFWSALWSHYKLAPSIAFCRVPEMEYAAQLALSGHTLDHSCGDGIFSELTWQGQQFSAGCDIDKAALERAKTRNLYQQLDYADVSQRLPYDDASFDLVFNNSALEHVENVQAALNEVGRILKPGGKFAFNVLNHRYFEWWALDNATAQAYRAWQPFHHALSKEDWNKLLNQAGLEIQSVKGYFDRNAARDLSYLDYTFSGYYIRQQKNRNVMLYMRYPRLAATYWRWRLGQHQWQTESDAGAGYFIVAGHRHG